MVQPKAAPVSFRPGEERLTRIEAWAKKRNLSRHLAILTLLDAGLRALEPPAEAIRLMRLGAEKKAKAASEKAAEPEPFKTRLKGEWSPPGGKRKA
jgi:hypothetical protein